MLQIRWNNGFYKIFDSFAYRDIAKAGTLKEAEVTKARIEKNRSRRKSK